MSIAPADRNHQRLIAVRYLETLTRVLRAEESAARRSSDLTAALTAGTWAERAQELRAYISNRREY